MYAKLKSGKVLKGKLAEIFVKKGLAVECDEPEKQKPVNPAKPVKPAKLK